MEDFIDIVPIPIVGDKKDSDLPDPVDYQYWVDRNNRIFYIDYDIDDTYYLVEFAKTIISMNKEDMDKPVDQLVPIKIFIMSYGGDIDQANFFCDLVKSSRIPIYTIATGAAMSAGMLILLSGHKRYMFRHSQILVHQGSAAFKGTADEIAAAQKQYKRQLDEMKEYILENTSIDEKTFDKNRSKDWYLNSDECVKYHIVDEIVSDLSSIL